MDILLIIGSFILLMVVGLLLLRVRIIIDTEQAQYQAQVIPIGRAELVIGDGTIGYRWKALFMHREGQFFPRSEPPRKKSKHPAQKKEKKKRISRFRPKPQTMLRMARALIPSFRVRRLRLRLDTGNAVWNAWLFPAFAFCRSRGHDVAVRFIGGTELQLDIDNSVHRMAGALIRSFIHKPHKP